jgi:Ricin-type beta-trefoil lectin domain
MQTGRLSTRSPACAGDETALWVGGHHVDRVRADSGIACGAPGKPPFAQEIQTTLQVSPQAGGHCIAVPDAFAPEQRLQMQDCNNSPSQTFGYDQAKAQLRIGGLCVDADGGRPGDLVKLAPCNGGARQSWKLEPRGEFAKLAGSTDLCLDIRYGSTEVGAPLQSWNCGEAEPNELWRLQKK